MVFSNLSPAEKDAFFSLLDEYFTSRPDVFGNAAPGPAAPTSAPPIPGVDRFNAATGRVAASAIHNAFTSHVNRSNDPPPEPAWKRPQSTSPQPSAAESAASSMGRVAAAAAVFKSANLSPGPPRPPPRRASSTSSPPAEHDEPPSLPGRTPSTAKLVAQKKFGDVDLSSGKNMYASIRHGTANKSATPPSVVPPVPAALPPIKNTFGPPPVRRVPSIASETKASPPPPPPPRRPEPEPEPEGDWAEALYEYSSEDPGDLELEPGQRVLIVEKTSDDWWTAEYQGRRGLVPAAYMKEL